MMAPGFTETIYGRGIGPFFASLLSNISGIIPVSLAEILVVVFVARQLSGVIKGFSEIRNDDRQFTNAICGWCSASWRRPRHRSYNLLPTVGIQLRSPFPREFASSGTAPMPK